MRQLKRKEWRLVALISLGGGAGLLLAVLLMALRELR